MFPAGIEREVSLLEPTLDLEDLLEVDAEVGRDSGTEDGWASCIADKRLDIAGTCCVSAASL